MTIMALARPHKGVVFDLADTLLWGKKNHWDFRANVYRKEGDLPPGIRKEKIFRVVNRIRKSLCDEEHNWEQQLYWPTVNAMALYELHPDLYGTMSLPQLLDRGRRIRKAIQKLHREWYRYPSEVGKLLSALRGAEVPFVLGSNHEGIFVQELLDEDYPALGRWFSMDCRFTPETVFVHKPDPGFLIQIARRIEQDPSDLVYVGNSPSNDAPMVGSGAQVILIDRDDHYHREIKSPEFQETYCTAMKERRLIVLRRPKDVADTLVAHFEGTSQ